MKTAVVTGGSRGIGKEIVEQLKSAGFNVAVLDRAENAKYQCDVSNMKQVQKACDKIVADFGGVDVLVNNAGITRDNLILRMGEDEFDAVINVNLKGVFNCTKVFMRPIMKSKTGRIINISSVSGLMGNLGQANYSAAKAGVIGLTKTTARELAGKGVTVNAVAPGFIDTDMTAVLPDNVKSHVLQSVPLKRMGTVAEIANIVTFLASEGASYITGQTIVVDGGLTM